MIIVIVGFADRVLALPPLRNSAQATVTGSPLTVTQRLAAAGEPGGCPRQPGRGGSESGSRSGAPAACCSAAPAVLASQTPVTGTVTLARSDTDS